MTTSPNLNLIPLKIIENSLEWLKNQDTVDNKCIGIYGRSKGGELALIAASIFLVSLV
ncbi:acyl-CoA thioester hydrolase/BAAT C-terminal domain-containing protein [endosymbiont 'TC1' of Trimyema compressum]|uniref:acyl-CoA thioester hydrolase/BAAT C-terminal domain-containing protein n=1 Tax=endosymbiont 'TC1' of Trimyema compressum TaxID=243899 RepID=UPI001FE03BD8|nr:acyl-CoA thioester hydrolase/BAAT C-terminal domain-containing protein [endosymbiont 'TC1' of Trimyema compressum]